MRALSIRQPWAWLILRPDLTGDARAAWLNSPDRKDIENREWATRYRGPVLIHAGKTMARSYYEDVADMIAYVAPGVVELLPAYEQLERGGVVGVATITDCVEHSPSRWFQGRYGFVLQDPRPLPFHACNGMLGFFDVPGVRL